MKRVKNTVASVAMLMIIAMNIAPLAVKAVQYPYPWGFGFDFSDEVDYTDIEIKNTSSSVRMTCDMADTDGSYRASVCAATSYGNIYDASHGYTYYFSEDTTYDMLNWVNENGYNRVCIKAICNYCDDEYGTNFTGYWNPDIY